MELIRLLIYISWYSSIVLLIQVFKVKYEIIKIILKIFKILNY